MWSPCHWLYLLRVTQVAFGGGLGEAQCAHCCLQGVQVADNARQGNINVSFSCSLHKDLCLRMSGLVDLLSSWCRRFGSSPGFGFSCYSLLFWLKKLRFYGVIGFFCSGIHIIIRIVSMIPLALGSSAASSFAS